MTTPASAKMVKRNRSFSNTRDKDSNKEETARSSEEEEKGMGDSTESEKDVRIDHGKKPEVSRSSSPEQFRSRYESEKESGSEEASSSLSSQKTVETDVRRRVPSISAHQDLEKHQTPTKKLSNESNHSISRYSRKTSSSEFDSKSGHQNSHVDEESKYQPARKLSNESNHEYSFPRYTRKTSSSDYNNSVTQMNGHDEYDFVPAKDNDRRRHSAPGGNSDSHDESNSNGNQYQPPPPTYKPKCTVDTSTTYSYYTRIRSRADEARRREAEAEKSVTQYSVTNSVTNRVTLSPVVNSRSFNYRRNRAATIERDMEVTVTVTEQPVTSVEPATTSWRSRIYGETTREAASYYPVRRRRPQSPETITTPESQHSTTRASR